MGEQISEMLEKLKRSGAASRIAIALGIGGMVLILLSEFWPTQPAQKKSAETIETAAYETQLETRLETLIAQIDGAGKTTVMVTLESTEINVYAVDTQQGEADAEQTHVLLDNGGALTETVETPAVRGVAVVCEGGDQLHVQAQITAMLASLLDLSANRISVAKMN